MCDVVSPGHAQEECAFRAAERALDPALCVTAGVWANDCRLHLWSGSFAEWAPKGAVPGNDDSLAAAELVKFGFAAGDLRPWSAWYRWIHGHTVPLDRAACSAVTDPDRAEACRRTALAHYGDLLNVARDRHAYPCDGGPLPRFLQYTPDAEIDALRASRTDLCPR